MKLVLIMLTRNSASILEQNLRYHLQQGVDHVVAMDDGSTDGAREVLESFEREGDLTLLPRPAGTYLRDESRWRTALTRQVVAEHRADWILSGDPDEFWWPLEGDLRNAFASVSSECDLVITPRHDFVHPSDANGEVLAHQTEVREVFSTYLQPKLAFRPFPDAIVDLGFHRIARDPSAEELTRWHSHTGRPLTVSAVVPARIFHYPILDGDRLAWAVRQTAESSRDEASYLQTRNALVRTGAGWREALFQTRDVLFRQASEDGPPPEGWEAAAPWRRKALEDGLESGQLRVDRRLANFLQGIRGTESPEPDEALKLQQCVIDHLGREAAELRKSNRRLNDKLARERALPGRRLGLYVERAAARLMRRPRATVADRRR